MLKSNDPQGSLQSSTISVIYDKDTKFCDQCEKHPAVAVVKHNLESICGNCYFKLKLEHEQTAEYEEFMKTSLKELSDLENGFPASEKRLKELLKEVKIDALWQRILVICETENEKELRNQVEINAPEFLQVLGKLKEQALQAQTETSAMKLTEETQKIQEKNDEIVDFLSKMQNLTQGQEVSPELAIEKYIAGGQPISKELKKLAEEKEFKQQEFIDFSLQVIDRIKLKLLCSNEDQEALKEQVENLEELVEEQKALISELQEKNEERFSALEKASSSQDQNISQNQFSMEFDNFKQETKVQAEKLESKISALQEEKEALKEKFDQGKANQEHLEKELNEVKKVQNEENSKAKAEMAELKAQNQEKEEKIEELAEKMRILEEKVRDL